MIVWRTRGKIIRTVNSIVVPEMIVKLIVCLDSACGQISDASNSTFYCVSFTDAQYSIADVFVNIINISVMSCSTRPVLL